MFEINMQIKIHEHNFTYRTTIFELLKWAWIQYLAVWIAVRFLFNKLDSFFYKNQIFETIVWNEKWKTN